MYVNILTLTGTKAKVDKRDRHHQLIVYGVLALTPLLDLVTDHE